MNILLISQCTKNALTETRRILDQFAERRGDRTWQTAITWEGLQTLHRLLRRSARKNTAVACHWIRGKDHSELLWLVGDARQFNAEGATPTNTTARDILRGEDENDWHQAEDIRLLASLAALLHDLGKANAVFQKKLTSRKAQADPFRHEWISLRLFEAFVSVGETADCQQRDCDWLKRLAALDEADTERVIANLRRDAIDPRTYSPFKTLTETLPLARAVGWLIVSHHRLPAPFGDALQEKLDPDLLGTILKSVRHDWCGSRLDDPKPPPGDCWNFPKGLPFVSRHWRAHARRLAEAILKRPTLIVPGAETVSSSPYVLHLARLALMLADHYYSAQPSHARYGDPARRGQALYANSLRQDSGQPKYNQRLDEHLIGVEVNAGRLMRALPRLEHSLPRIARHRGLRARSPAPYGWQNRAFELAEGLCAASAEQGFFGVNMASTGCGKTFANARILYGLANPRLGARFSVALGLRTLTLQTGDAYRERLGLGDEDLAVLVGGAATQALHERGKARAASEQSKKDIAPEELAGRESAVELLPEHSYVRYEGSLEDGPLRRWLYPERAADARMQRRGRDAVALLDAPVLVCTVDHLMPATEGTRGGRQILPMLRLMSADLVLDEPDDFDLADLPALSRLVHWAGLLGSRVLLSSATLPPALVQGLFLAYCAGRAIFQRHRGTAGPRLAVCCAWFDEFGATSDTHDHGDSGAAFLAAHHAFVERRIRHLAQQHEPRRRAAIVPVPITPATTNDHASRQIELCGALAAVLLDGAERLHRQHHETDPRSGKRASFGLIRMANIDPLWEVALALFKRAAAAGCHIHLCVYHSQHPALVRSALEQTLDTVLRRHKQHAVFQHPAVRRCLDGDGVREHLFIVLASPVAEVGRDHDYDWAIVEPSSLRSIIQLAGRVMRHRDMPCPVEQPNILLLETNIQHLVSGPNSPAFVRPGFESEDFRLKSHNLNDLLTPQQWQVIDAGARIRERDVAQFDPGGNLADLEHAALKNLMLGAAAGQTQQRSPVGWWWDTAAHLTGILQGSDPFRAGRPRRTFVLMPDEDCTEVGFYLLPERAHQERTDRSELFTSLTDAEVMTGQGITPWAVPEYLPALLELAEDLALDPANCAPRFGTFDLLTDRDSVQYWRYHPMLGFSRQLQMQNRL